MTRDEAEIIVASYDDLVNRAIDIMRPSGPPWGNVFEEALVKLSFEGEDAVLTEPEVESFYDSHSVSERKTRFPAALLFMDADELASWREQTKRRYESEQKAAAEKRRVDKDDEERRAYEALKKKFGG